MTEQTIHVGMTHKIPGPRQYEMVELTANATVVFKDGEIAKLDPKDVKRLISVQETMTRIVTDNIQQREAQPESEGESLLGKKP